MGDRVQAVRTSLCPVVTGSIRKPVFTCNEREDVCGCDHSHHLLPLVILLADVHTVHMVVNNLNQHLQGTTAQPHGSWQNKQRARTVCNLFNTPTQTHPLLSPTTTGGTPGCVPNTSTGLLGVECGTSLRLMVATAQATPLLQTPQHHDPNHTHLPKRRLWRAGYKSQPNLTTGPAV